MKKTSDVAFQAFWIEINFSGQRNIICGVIYRQHNSPQRFQEYFDATLEKLSASNKSIIVMGDFNVNLLAVETCNYAHNFLLSLQSFSLIPTIDKPTRVYNDFATLIDNILINKFDEIINSGNIISDISDHYSQRFCIIDSVKEKAINRKTLRRDFAQFSEKDFTKDLSQIDWEAVVSGSQTNINRSFSTFFNKI